MKRICWPISSVHAITPIEIANWMKTSASRSRSPPLG